MPGTLAGKGLGRFTAKTACTSRSERSDLSMVAGHAAGQLERLQIYGSPDTSASVQPHTGWKDRGNPAPEYRNTEGPPLSVAVTSCMATYHDPPGAVNHGGMKGLIGPDRSQPC